MKYRKKPLVIEAFQLNDRGLVGEEWFWDAVSKNDIITHNFGKHYLKPAWCEIKTLEGIMIANSGDYIIKGILGEFYPCQPDIFHKTYEILEPEDFRIVNMKKLDLIKEQREAIALSIALQGLGYAIQEGYITPEMTDDIVLRKHIAQAIESLEFIWNDFEDDLMRVDISGSTLLLKRR